MKKKFFSKKKINFFEKYLKMNFNRWLFILRKNNWIFKKIKKIIRVIYFLKRVFKWRWLRRLYRGIRLKNFYFSNYLIINILNYYKNLKKMIWFDRNEIRLNRRFNKINKVLLYNRNINYNIENLNKNIERL